MLSNFISDKDWTRHTPCLS